MSFIVHNNYQIVKITLKSEFESTLYLSFKRNKVTQVSRPSTIDSTNHTHTWRLNLSEFNIDDELTDFRIYTPSAVELSKFGGIVWLLDGEEIIDVNNGEVDPETEEEIREINGNSYTTKFNEIGEHTIQAVFKGNKKYTSSTTPIKTFYVEQEEAGGGGTVPVSEIWRMEFINQSTSSFKYADGSSVTAKLTKGGVAITGASVTMTVLSDNVGYQYTATTKADGTVNLLLGRLEVGSHTLVATYSEDGEVVCSSQRKIKIVKNDPTIKHQNQNTSRPNTYYAGDEIWIQFIEPDYTALNDQTFPIYVNGKVHNIMTNVNGRVWLRLWYSGTYRFKAVFTGNKNLNKKTKEFTIVVH